MTKNRVHNRETVAVDKVDLTAVFEDYLSFCDNEDNLSYLSSTLDEFFTKYHKLCYNQLDDSKE